MSRRNYRGKRKLRWYEAAQTRSNAAARRRQATNKKTPGSPQPAAPGASATSQFFGQVIKWLRGPIGAQLLAIVLMFLGLLSIVTIAGFNSGKLINNWAKFLVLVFGWGAYPVSVLIFALGLLWLRHLVHQHTVWRWRPFLGFELTLVGMLTLSWAIITRNWTLVESGQGGGLIGWSLYQFLSRNIGPLATVVVIMIITIWGLLLAFDITGREMQTYGTRLGAFWRRVQHAWRTANAQAVGTHAAPRAYENDAIIINRGGNAQETILDRSAIDQPDEVMPPKAKATQRTAPVVPPLSVQPESTPKRDITQKSVKAEPAEPTSKRSRVSRGLTTVADVPLTLLKATQVMGMSQDEIQRKSDIIEETLRQFDAPGKVIEVRPGPTVTQFGVSPEYVKTQTSRRKVRVSQIAALDDDLALALAAKSLRVEAPVPGRAVVGIEVPNSEIATVTLRAVLESDVFKKNRKPLSVAVGLDVAGSPQVMDLAKMPHLLVAGTTGSGKSVFVKALAASLVMNNTPETLRMIMIDPKMVELSHFNGLPHLLGPTETDLEDIIRVLRWVAHEMDQRYKLFAETHSRNLEEYNTKVTKQRKSSDEDDTEILPYIVVFIDELADLMMSAPEETERLLARIAQMARATGIHMVVATQRPSTDVITGLIKANFPARVSFATTSNTDSRVIIDTPGAQNLLGKGDMLFLPPDAAAPLRVQGCLISDEEIAAIINFWQKQVGATPAKGPWEVMSEAKGPDTLRLEGHSDDADLLEQAIAMARKRGNISSSGLQRGLHISYPRAARLMEEMEEMGIVGPQEAAGRKRRVILGGDDY